mmetsp:Transcript_28803/g.73438  ORF Transcript_28803/g.73438 Transcript_28803/m.73438 type:complete len:219 (-) Transcript_28803:585-1241(-)
MQNPSLWKLARTTHAALSCPLLTPLSPVVGDADSTFHCMGAGDLPPDVAAATVLASAAVAGSAAATWPTNSRSSVSRKPASGVHPVAPVSSANTVARHAASLRPLPSATSASSCSTWSCTTALGMASASSAGLSAADTGAVLLPSVPRLRRSVNTICSSSAPSTYPMAHSQPACRVVMRPTAPPSGSTLPVAAVMARAAAAIRRLENSSAGICRRSLK